MRGWSSSVRRTEPSGHLRRLKAMAQEYDRIVLAGALFGADLWALYKNCKLFTLPSTHEGMSFSLLEAAVAGALIVASDIPANALVCRGFGRLFAVGSTNDLAAALAAEWSHQRKPEESQEQTMIVAARHDWGRSPRGWRKYSVQRWVRERRRFANESPSS